MSITVINGITFKTQKNALKAFEEVLKHLDKSTSFKQSKKSIQAALPRINIHDNGTIYAYFETINFRADADGKLYHSGTSLSDKPDFFELDV